VSAPLLSVVIPSYDSAALLAAGLTALDAQVQEGTDRAFEIIVVDDGSADGTVERVEALRLRAPLRLIRQRRRGRAAARNAGAAAAAAPVLLFLDADVRPEPGLIEAHLRHYRGGTRVGVQGRTLQHPATLTTIFMRATNLLPDLTVRRREDLSPLHVITRNFSVLAAAFREVGGFDEAFAGYGWEDIELGLRLRQAGVRLRYEPAALAYHHHRQSLEDLQPKLRQAGAGAVYFWNKWGRPAWLGLFLEIHPVLLPLKWLVYRTGPVTKAAEALRPFAERRQILPLCSEIYNHLLWRAYYEGVFAARRPARGEARSAAGAGA
jgi:GT2 family glycosyltransferase